MIIDRIKATDFLIFKSVDLDLKSISLASIIGYHDTDQRKSNGSGKSSLIELIRYALFDQTRGKIKNQIIRQGQDFCTVEIHIRVGVNHLRIFRKRERNSSWASVWVDGKRAGDKISVVNAVVNEHTGIDSELFDLIYFFKQNDQFGFCESLPTKRKEILSKVFKLNDIDKCLTHVSEQLSISKKDLDRLEGSLSTLTQEYENLDTVRYYEDLLDSIYDELSMCISRSIGLGDLHSDLNDSTIDFATQNQSWRGEIADDRNKITKLNDDIDDINNRIASNQIKIQSLNSELGQKQSELGQIKTIDDTEVIDYSKSIEQARKDRNDNEIELQNLTVEERVLAQANIDLQPGSECPTCKQVVDRFHINSKNDEISQRLSDIAKKKKSLVSLSHELLLKLNELSDRNTAAIEFESNKRAIKIIKDGIKKINKEIKDCNSSNDNLNHRRNQLFQEQLELTNSIDSDLINSFELMISFYQQKLQLCSRHAESEIKNNNDELIRLNRRFDEVEFNLSRKLEINDKIDELKKRISDKKDSIFVYQNLSVAFGKSGIRSLIIENIINVIEQFANDILVQMQTPFKIEFNTQRKLQSGEDRDSLDIMIYDNGAGRMFEYYSGGEKCLINLAIRLSLSKVMSSMHGVKVQGLYLDEILGSLDEFNREEVIKVVSFLSRSFDQIFVISHTDEIKDVVDTGIVIRRYSDYSSVELTNTEVA